MRFAEVMWFLLGLVLGAVIAGSIAVDITSKELAWLRRTACEQRHCLAGIPTWNVNRCICLSGSPQ
jgi:hypothetical protein